MLFTLWMQEKSPISEMLFKTESWDINVAGMSRPKLEVLVTGMIMVVSIRRDRTGDGTKKKTWEERSRELFATRSVLLNYTQDTG